MAALLILLFLLAFTVIFTFVMATSLAGFVMTRVPYVRTRSRDVIEIISKTPISSSDVFFDLGSGDGRVVFLVENVTGARVKGFELTLWSHLWSRVKRFAKRSRAELVYGNFFKRDFSEATVIYCYLYPNIMRMIGDKVLAECKPGTKVISRDFPISNLPETISWRSTTGHSIYLYQI